jgi:hypothetical protein
MMNTNEQMPISTKWIESLALEEIHMEESGVINFNQHLNPSQQLEESSIELMEKLRERFEIYLTKFNELRGNSRNAGLIKIFKISNTVNDFMLFRNSLKLVVARRAVDVISIGFLSSAGGLFAARTGMELETTNKIHELKANVGSFNNITWRFNGETFDIDALVRHYLTEFIRHSTR